MMSRFPKMVTRYMDRNRLKMRGYNFGSSVSPRRRKSDTAVWFIAFIVVNDSDGKDKSMDSNMYAPPVEVF
jgi:hypothetical protein